MTKMKAPEASVAGRLDYFGRYVDAALPTR